tara:strand:- start:404 stop:715 length:312 start_codon:yes stop_codon:yes gene_type:complete
MSFGILMGEIKIIKPNTRPMFAILEPKTLDIARSDEPSNADLMLTISSGADVAKETTVIPISILAMLNFKEIETADFKSKFPPNISRANPKNNNKKVLIPILK